MADYKGIAGAFGKAGAALTDSAQGTQFYKEALDREKEERARQFALDQMQEEKQKLNNENARRGLTSLIKATGTKIEALANDPLAVTNSGLGVLNADMAALQGRILNDPNLTEMDREIAITQLGSYGTALNSVVDWGAINAAASSPNMITEYGKLSPRGKLKAQGHPTINVSLAKGEETFTTLQGIDMQLEGSLLDQPTKELVASVQGSKANSFSDLTTVGAGLATQIGELDMNNINESRQKSVFMNIQMTEDKNRKLQELAQGGPLSESTTTEEITAILDKVYSPDNLLVTPKGVTYIRSAEEMLTPVFNKMMTEMTDETLPVLLDYAEYAHSYDAAFPSLNFSVKVGQQIKNKLNAYTPSSLDQIRDNFTEKKFWEIEDITDFVIEKQREEGADVSLELQNIASKINAIWNKEGTIQYINEVQGDLAQQQAEAIDAVGEDFVAATPLAGDLSAMGQVQQTLSTNLRTNMLLYLNGIVESNADVKDVLENVLGFGTQENIDFVNEDLVKGKKWGEGEDDLNFADVLEFWRSNITQLPELAKLEVISLRRALVDNTVADIREMFKLTSENLLFDEAAEDDTVSELIGLFGLDDEIGEQAKSSPDGRVIGLLSTILERS